MTKLSPSEVQALLRDYQDWYTPQELTVIYRVSLRTVFRILAKSGIKRKNRPRVIRKEKVPPRKTRVLQPCGTNAAYQRHRRHGEYPCPPCLEAHALNVQQAKEKRNAKNESGRSRPNS